MLSLQSNPDGIDVRVLGSHVRLDSPVLSVADVAFLEPDLTGAEWVDWAVSVCREEQVDVLWATREAAAVAAAAERFAQVGTKVLVPSVAALRGTAAKSDVYERAERLGIPTPPWTTATGPVEAARAVRAMRPHSPDGVCVKPDSGQGAEEVYRLVDAADGLPSAWELPTPLWVEHTRRHPDLCWIVLPWLPGPEHSIDALRSRDGRLLAACVRTKSPATHEQVARHDPHLVDLSARLLADLDVAPLGNVQFRERSGLPVLLEVNPRASGGIYRSSAALGVDLVWAAIRAELLGDAGVTETVTLRGREVRTTTLEMILPVPPTLVIHGADLADLDAKVGGTVPSITSA